MNRLVNVLLLGILLGIVAAPCWSQEANGAPWRQDSIFQEIAVVLDSVWAIDGHSHLHRFAPYAPQSPSPSGPLGVRITDPAVKRAVESRFGVNLTEGIEAVARQVEARRKEGISRFGQTKYWLEHLDRTNTRIAFLNGNEVPVADLDHIRLRWVPSATTLLFPLPGDGFLRRQGEDRHLRRNQAELGTFLSEVGLDSVPESLEEYLHAVDQILNRWRAQGAVAVKFFDAYLRTLRFADIPHHRAASLFARGVGRHLSRTEYIEVQDHIARHIFAVAAKEGLVVHIHSSSGRPPFLRLEDADVRNLESVLTDQALFGTQFVLIHGGYPLTREAAYLAIKPHVWVDISAMGWFPPPDLAEMLRIFLLVTPGSMLFGTDATVFPGVPGGAEVTHIARSRVTREALYLALAGLVRDGVVDLEHAVQLGRDVLAGNARRLYGWDAEEESPR